LEGKSDIGTCNMLCVQKIFVRMLF